MAVSMPTQSPIFLKSNTGYKKQEGHDGPKIAHLRPENQWNYQCWYRGSQDDALYQISKL